MTVRTRFAPSPTGYLHIGGVRTALFNWLFAKGQGGQFILRVDDTDQQRNVDAALAPILNGFRWLGLDWDEGPDKGGLHGPYYQSQRGEKYQAAVEELLTAGAAYRDFATTEEIQAERELAQQAGAPFTYSRQWMAETDADVARFQAEGRQSVVRLKMPRQGELVLHDLVRGEVRFQWAREQDHVIQRADGSCLYHLATVVDDHDMQISHVIRAEEHLSNTPRQVFIAQQLGCPLPEFAHLPYVAEPGSKNKLSKRKLQKYLRNPEFRAFYDHGIDVAALLDHELNRFIEERGLPDADVDDRNRVAEEFRRRLPVNIPRLSDDPLEQNRMEDIIRNHTLDLFNEPAIIEMYQKGRMSLATFGIERNPETFNPIIIDFYEQVGYLSDAILNYLLLLGWSLDDKTEDFTREEMIRYFSLDRVIKSPASFDAKKLMAFQARAMQRLTAENRFSLVRLFLKRAGWDIESNEKMIRQIVDLAGERIRFAGDIVDYAHFFSTDDGFEYDPKAFEKRLRKAEGAVELLTEFRGQLAAVEPFTADELERCLKTFVDAKGIKIGQIVHALRVAVTGKAVGFGLFETLAILGRERCLARIDRALKL